MRTALRLLTATVLFVSAPARAADGIAPPRPASAGGDFVSLAPRAEADSSIVWTGFALPNLDEGASPKLLPMAPPAGADVSLAWTGFAVPAFVDAALATLGPVAAPEPVAPWAMPAGAGGDAIPSHEMLDVEQDVGEALPGGEGEAEPSEGAQAAGSDGSSGGHRYTGDIDDATLERLWKELPEKVGSLSIGFTDAGRLVNGLPFPQGPQWKVTDPANTFGTEETIAYIVAALSEVASRFEGAPIRIGHISKPKGGWLRPHRSHQSGRDVDFAFYETVPRELAGRVSRERIFDVPRNWALVRAIVTQTDVQFILVDRRIQKRLYDYALSIGEDRGWLDSLFKNGRDSIVQHARRHRDHFHVRFYNPRAQELGRRVQPLMTKGPSDYNAVVHRVRKGECLGAIARRYDTSVQAIRRANGLRNNALRAGRTLIVPLAGPCVNCPQPPEVVVPPRRLPPSTPGLFAKEQA